MNKVNYIPAGYNSIMPALAFQGADAAIKWYTENFGATEKMRFSMPDGSIAHAELVIGDSVIMLAEENSEYNKTPKTLGGNSINICVYLPDVDAVIRKAAGNGARVIIPPADQFYGDRSGRIEDPFGYIWIISTHIKDMTEAEMKKAMDEMMSQQQPAN